MKFTTFGTVVLAAATPLVSVVSAFSSYSGAEDERAFRRYLDDVVDDVLRRRDYDGDDLLSARNENWRAHRAARWEVRIHIQKGDDKKDFQDVTAELEHFGPLGPTKFAHIEKWVEMNFLQAFGFDPKKTRYECPPYGLDSCKHKTVRELSQAKDVVNVFIPQSEMDKPTA